MPFTLYVTKLLSIMVVMSHLFLLIFLFIKIFSPKKLKFIGKRWMLFAFIIALVATSGSLFFSEIAKYEPCKLCWFQRIFMYPLVLILGIALWKKDENVSSYVMPMSLIGGLIAGYHYFISTFAKVKASGFCSATGPSCLVEYFTEYGYVTIPMMALTAFCMIFIFTYFRRKMK
jgi:disulfide bond formation protein DsbB